MNDRASRHHRTEAVAANPRTMRIMVQLSLAIVAVAFLLGGLPQSDAVRDRLARAGFVSSGRGDAALPSTTTTLPPPPPNPVDLDAQLTTAGYPNVVATVVDRQVTLEGTVPDEASRGVVLRLVQTIPGIDSVLDNMVVERRSPVTIDADTPEVTGENTGEDTAGVVMIVATTSRIALSGSVPDQATADAVLGAVQAVYGADQVDGSVLIDVDAVSPVEVSIALETTRPELAARLKAVFDALDAALVRLTLDYVVLEPSAPESAIADVLAASPIEFALGSSTIALESETTLDAIAEVLIRFPESAVEVGGHTDATGSDQVNRSLSARRAEAVIAALRQRGVENEMVAAGYGATRPLIEPATTDAERTANRRTEFLVLES